MNEQTLAKVALFLRDLGLSMHVSGAPAQELEEILGRTGSQLGVQVDGFAVLTFLAMTIIFPDGTRRTEMMRLPPYDYNMTRLIELRILCSEIGERTDLDTHIARLSAIMRQPLPWGGWRYAAMGFLLSASVAVLLRGGWAEVVCGGLIGFFFTAACQFLARVPRLGAAVPVILCALAAMLAQGLTYLLPGQSPFISAVAGVVLLLPGFTLTVAMSELSTQNYLAGTGRLTAAFILLFLMGGGLAIGTALSQAVLPITDLAIQVQPLPNWTIWPAVAVLGISLLAVLQAPISTWPISIGACLLAWASYAAVSDFFGNVVGAFTGALIVAVAGHIYQWASNRPAVLLETPGLITLVPGSMGFRGLHALMQRDSIAGINMITDMVITGAVLAVGLLLADNIMPLVFRGLTTPKSSTAR